MSNEYPRRFNHSIEISYECKRQVPTIESYRRKEKNEQSRIPVDYNLIDTIDWLISTDNWLRTQKRYSTFTTRCDCDSDCKRWCQCRYWIVSPVNRVWPQPRYPLLESRYCSGRQWWRRYRIFIFSTGNRVSNVTTQPTTFPLIWISAKPPFTKGDITDSIESYRQVWYRLRPLSNAYRCCSFQKRW